MNDERIVTAPIYFKATRLDGTDFRTGKVRYEVGKTITHPNPHLRDPSGYLSVATVPTDCTGMKWPCRLFEVTAEEVWRNPKLPNKRCTHSLTVVRELDPLLALGPQGEHVMALIDRVQGLTSEEAERLKAVRDAAAVPAWNVAWDAAWFAVRDAARDAAAVVAWDAAVARDTARALVVRDLIGHGFTQEHYDTLTQPWRTVIGPIHPDDPDLRAVDGDETGGA